MDGFPEVRGVGVVQIDVAAAMRNDGVATNDEAMVWRNCSARAFGMVRSVRWSQISTQSRVASSSSLSRLRCEKAKPKMPVASQTNAAQRVGRGPTPRLSSPAEVGRRRVRGVHAQASQCRMAAETAPLQPVTTGMRLQLRRPGRILIAFDWTTSLQSHGRTAIWNRTRNDQHPRTLSPR